MRALKGLVIGMGVLIVLGIALLFYGLATRLGGGADGTVPAAAGGGADFGIVRTALPAGARVGTVAVQDGRILVPVLLPGGGAELRLFSLVDGRPLGAILLDPAE